MADAGFHVTAGEMEPIVPLIQERLKTLAEVGAKAGFFFRETLTYEPRLLIGKKMTAAESLNALTRARDTLAALPDFSTERTESAMRALADELGLKAGPLFGIVRVAVTGEKVSPPLFETMEVLGQARALARLDRAQAALASIT
jgi:glutamyl-tRNA synthetase